MSDKRPQIRSILIVITRYYSDAFKSTLFHRIQFSFLFARRRVALALAELARLTSVRPRALMLLRAISKRIIVSVSSLSMDLVHPFPPSRITILFAITLENIVTNRKEAEMDTCNDEQALGSECLTMQITFLGSGWNRRSSSSFILFEKTVYSRASPINLTFGLETDF